jgi:SAM-dependent methyltransferase
MADQDLREAVRERYAAVATGTGCCDPASCGCADPASCGCGGPASCGCGDPTAVAELHEGEVVLDLGSGGGRDVLDSARRVGPSGRAYGLDMTDEMLALARENAVRAGVANVEWLRGLIEAIPLPDASVDAVISNCVINLSTDKPRVFREVARVLRPGGRIAIADILADPDMDEPTRRDTDAWTGCIAGALTRDQLAELLEGAGLRQIEIRETHRVHRHAGSAIITAVMPAAPLPPGPSG